MSPVAATARRALALPGLGPVRVVVRGSREALRWRGVLPVRDVLKVRSMSRRRGSGDGPNTEVFVSPLGHSVELRSGTSDADVVRDTFVGLYHLPPLEMSSPTTILDLGSNIGLTVAHYAVLFPAARVLGVELDPNTAAVATRNIAPWSDRCEVLEGAAWTSTEIVSFGRVVGEEWAAHVGGEDGEQVSVQGFSLNTLVERLGGSVDFVKMDIEGAEADVLTTNTEWAASVRAMKVEVHTPYTREQALRDVTALGFEARPDDRHWSGIVAIRR